MFYIFEWFIERINDLYGLYVFRICICNYEIIMMKIRILLNFFIFFYCNCFILNVFFNFDFFFYV